MKLKAAYFVVWKRKYVVPAAFTDSTTIPSFSSNVKSEPVAGTSPSVFAKTIVFPNFAMLLWTREITSCPG